MRKFYLILTSLCILFAFFLPSSLAKTREGGTEVTKPKLVQPLEASVLTEAVYLPTIVPKPVVATPVASGCGNDPYMAYIYQHESGCNPSAVNSIGCRGIGQACPGSKLPCGADFACQDAWFKQYAISRYGSPYLAMLAWQGQLWW